MTQFTQPFNNRIACATVTFALLGSLTCATPLLAAAPDNPPTVPAAVQKDVAPAMDEADKMEKGNDRKALTSEERVEMRIQKLHDKLKISADQEDQWRNVAQVMRDNEASFHALMSARHENAKTMSAIDDLQSYEQISEAHADGLKKLIPAFQELYDTFTDTQKKNADEVFGRFEGHRDGKHHEKPKSGK